MKAQAPADVIVLARANVIDGLSQQPQRNMSGTCRPHRAHRGAMRERPGIAARTGAVKVGLEADLIVVAGDPLANIRSLREVRLVVNGGRVAVDRITR